MTATKIIQIIFLENSTGKKRTKKRHLLTDTEDSDEDSAYGKFEIAVTQRRLSSIY